MWNLGKRARFFNNCSPSDPIRQFGWHHRLGAPQRSRNPSTRDGCRGAQGGSASCLAGAESALSWEEEGSVCDEFKPTSLADFATATWPSPTRNRQRNSNIEGRQGLRTSDDDSLSDDHDEPGIRYPSSAIPLSANANGPPRCPSKSGRTRPSSARHRPERPPQLGTTTTRTTTTLTDQLQQTRHIPGSCDAAHPHHHAVISASNLHARTFPHRPGLGRQEHITTLRSCPTHPPPRRRGRRPPGVSPAPSPAQYQPVCDAEPARRNAINTFRRAEPVQRPRWTA